MSTSESLASHKYDVVNSINIRKSVLETSGYIYFILFQNPKNVVKFDNNYLENGYLF